MEFGLADTRLLIGGVSLALIVLAILLFGSAALLGLFSWVKGKIFGSGKPRAQVKQAIVKEIERKVVAPIAAPIVPAVVKPAEKKNAPVLVPAKEGKGKPAAHCPAETAPGVAKFVIKKVGATMEISDESGKRMGFVTLGETWNGAQLASLYCLEDDDTRVAVEARPLRTRSVGALCSAVDPGTGEEIALLGTLYRQQDSRGAPKPIYDTTGNLLAEFTDVESAGGFTSAKLKSADGRDFGAAYAKAADEWRVEIRKGAPVELRVLMLALAQMISEQSR